jgi:hypothetical protein
MWLPALFVFRATGVAIVVEADGVGFERAEDIVRSAILAGFEAHSIPNLAIAFPPFRGSIFPIGGLLVHGFPCFLSCWTKVHAAKGVKGGGFAPCISPLTPVATMGNPAGQKKADSLVKTARSATLLP